MNNRKRKRGKRLTGDNAVRKASAADEETRQSVAVTVAWMLTWMTTLMLTVVGIALSVYVDARAESAKETALLAGLLLFSAGVTGIVCLLLVPVVYHVRETRPPAAITVVAIVTGIAPWLAALFFGSR